jgi:PKD repeat protein
MFGFCINRSHAQSTKYFERFFYTDSINLPLVVARGLQGSETQLNNYIITGINAKSGNILNTNDGFVLKLNNNGDSILIKEGFSENDKRLLIAYHQELNNKIFLSGNYFDTITYTTNIFLLKLDTSFNELSRNYLIIDTSFINTNLGVVMGSNMHNIKCLSDSTFLIMGATNIPDTIAKPIYFKVDTLGNILWRKKLEHPISGILNSIFNNAVELPDSSIIFVGYRNLNFENSDLWLVKTNKDGELIWSNYSYSSPAPSGTQDYGFGIIYLPQENNLLVAGHYLMRPAIFKTDTAGNLLQWFTFPKYKNGNDSPGFFYGVIQGHENTVVGYGYRNNQAYSNIWEALAVKYDMHGNILWTRAYKGYGYGLVSFDRGIATSDGGYLFTGAAFLAVYNQNTLKQIVYVVKTNCLGFTGPPQAQMQCSGTGLNYTFTNLSERADTCYLDFGDGSSVLVFRAEHDTLPINHTYATEGIYQITLIATACGEADTMVCSFNTSTGALYNVEEELSVYPNPAINQISIKAAREIQTIKIYNSLGALVYNETGINANTKMINVETLKSGIYYMEIEGGFGIIKEKFIKE